MTSSKLKSERETLLVYIPCYTDYKLALNQGLKIREIQAIEKVLPLEILIMISCNGAELSDAEKREFEEICNYSNILSFGISGDINITQGFMHAIRIKADYLWILSSNDAVSNEFMKTIYNELMQRHEANVLVGCTSDRVGLRNVNSVFDSRNQDIPFGLISSVVYRTKELDRNFDSAVQMNWTGWGQLAAIEASCIALNGIVVSLVPEKSLYDRSIRSFDNQNEEEKRVRNGYAHSFFGMPIVINTLHADNIVLRRKYLDGWICSNWYLVNYFLRTDFKLWNSHVASNQIWLREFSFAAVKNASFWFRLLFRLSKKVDFYAFRRIKFAQWIRRKLDR
jgi:hypothetical protein